MTIHREMFDKEEKKEQAMEELPTQHRVFVEFEGGYYFSLGGQCPDFQEMVAECGRPVRVTFRATDEGWYKDDGDDGDEGGLL